MLIIFVLPQIKISMQQIYHSNATTNINIRTQIQNNSVTNSELAIGLTFLKRPFQNGKTGILFKMFLVNPITLNML